MKQDAFTLIELLVSMAISTMVLVLITMFVLDISNAGTTYGQSILSLQESGLASTIMNSEITAAAQSVQGSFPIISVSPQSFSFYSDTDGDSVTDQVRYFLSGTTLQKGVIRPGGNPLAYVPSSEIVTDLLHNVVASAGATVFSYYDNTYTGSQVPLPYPIDVSKVGLVRITLTTDENASQEPGPVSSTYFVDIRNLRIQ
jgi:prepilin-type N-terminal cleavage/methylation domain-containing protein